MILAIDAGNTRLKWGWHDGARWISVGDLKIAELAELADLADLAERNPDAGGANPLTGQGHVPQQIVIANVAGENVAARLSAWITGFGVPAHWLRAERERCGVTNLYDTPEQLGADRWAALIAARALLAGECRGETQEEFNGQFHGEFHGECLVVCAGTATTADILNARGEFSGGVILPGSALMKAALHHNTGGLPLGEGRVLAAGRNTLDAIESGCMHAQAGAIERMHRALSPEAGCLVSGGAGRALAQSLAFPARYVENLVLEGLALVAARN